MYNNYNPYYTQNYNAQSVTPQNNPYQQRMLMDNQIGHQPTNNYQQQVPMLQGKQVESVDIVRSIEIPLDGTISYFPVADGTAIVTKQLQTDGTSKITIFKPSNDKKKEIEYITRDELKDILDDKQKDEPEYITQDELKDILKDLHLDDIEDDIKDIKKQLKKKGD